MRLPDLPPGRKRRKRRGRGVSSGRGGTSGRGTKGQKARAGARIRTGFEGGQTPMFQRFPKRRGFQTMRIRSTPVSLARLEAALPAGTTVDLGVLKRAGLVPKRTRVVKILSDGELTKALVVCVPVSKAAQGKIEKAGGRVEPSPDAQVERAKA